MDIVGRLLDCMLHMQERIKIEVTVPVEICEANNNNYTKKKRIEK